MRREATTMRLFQQSLPEAKRLVAFRIVTRRARIKPRDFHALPRGLQIRVVAEVDANVVNIASTGEEKHEVPAAQTGAIPACRHERAVEHLLIRVARQVDAVRLERGLNQAGAIDAG